MTESRFLQREREALRNLVRLVAERKQGEELPATYQARVEAAKAEYAEVRQTATTQFQAEKEKLKAEYDKVRQAVTSRADAELQAAQKEYSEARSVISLEFETDQRATQTEFEEARWTISTFLEANKNKIEIWYQNTKDKIKAQHEKIQEVRNEMMTALGPWLGSLLPSQEDPGWETPEEDETPRLLQKQIDAAQIHLEKAKSLFLPRLMQGKRFLWILLVVWLLSLAPAALFAPWYLWLIAGTVGVLVVGGGLHFWLRSMARAQVQRIYQPLSQALTEADVLVERYRDQTDARRLREQEKVQKLHDNDQRKADEKFRQRLAKREKLRDTDLGNAKQRYSSKLMDIEERRDTDLRRAEDKYPRLMAESKQRYETTMQQAEERCRRELAESKAWFEQSWNTMQSHWHDGLAQTQQTIIDVNQESARLFPEWNDGIWNDWKPPQAMPGGIRFGELTVRLADIPEGIPTDEKLKPRVPTNYQAPALFPFPGLGSMVLEVKDEGKAWGETALQLAMFRILTAVPPGKVRFTIIDPVGLGRNYAAFMHLADYDEALVTNKIWTEQQQIEHRLADLTGHMEKVIQKYLRNQFATIEEYNEQAGEVAEPFRVLVVANFPIHFSTEALRRLVSVAHSGARCGVSVLVTVDQNQPLPLGFDVADLARHGVHLVWTNGQFIWKDPDLGRYPFRLDGLPDDLFMTRILQHVGQEAKKAKRVEVPFEFITPPEEQWWKGYAGAGVDIPLGRAGATKRQHMQLGRGTSQHVLVAGKTGSGKSTLLHALITNAALVYSPFELEMYLIDFKEGVEFKAYAAHELPHARVVAIESEREFGLSVLQRLEGELKMRGDRFRSLGVQDLNAYRQIEGQPPLPRVLLIVDEFQLFFVEDDKIAQEAALLLDRLVRQGRAFGIHVLLGSQTLGGAYSLARSTIGQMAVRIALQCSEADAHLILSEDNPAARLLSRPGEAIYNDANGLVEGNDFFQVCWLSEESREQYLEKLERMALAQHYQRPHPPIVFEGRAPAEVRKNYLLRKRLEAPGWPALPSETLAWLGEAIAIKDPTAASFRSQSGSNLLMIGQMEEPALAILMMMLISLAAQYAPEATGSNPGAKFYVLDDMPPDAPNAGALGRLSEVVPHAVRAGRRRDVAEILGEVAAQVDQRHAAPDAPAPAIFLFIYGLQRLRDIRPEEEDFGFSRSEEDKPASPGKLFGSIIREGPAVGIHTIIWCDSLNNANRAIDRQVMREFELKVLFQMSNADSSNLIDSPAASKLGLHRALYYTEERGQPEKFRPYGHPSDEWLAEVKQLFDRKRSSV